MVILIAAAPALITIPAYISRNDVYIQHDAVVRARIYDWRNVARENNVFIGVAISGGGSRAANFSLAVLEELEQHGFLDNLTALSSVSGGSLTAAYYALFRKTPEWDWEEAREKLRTDFFARFLIKYFLPHNILRTTLSHYDRSDIMAEVFDGVLYQGKSFHDLGSAGPKLFINSTAQENQPNHTFVFEEEEFTGRVFSRLDTYPISYAVMASGAFPGIFNNVTLENFLPRLSLDDFIDPTSVATSIKVGKDPLSTHIREHLALQGHSLLTKYVPNSAPSQDLLVELLTYLTFFNGSTLTDDQLRGYKLSERTQELYRRKKSSDEELRSPNISNFFREHPYSSPFGEYPYVKSRRASEERVLGRALLEDIYPGIKKSRPTYQHLYDGGASDNLGLKTIQKAATTFSEAVPLTRKPRGCFIFAIDAHPLAPRSWWADDPDHLKADTRTILDHFIDGNGIKAIDLLMAQQRQALLASRNPYGLWTIEIIDQTFPFGDSRQVRTCSVWHIALENLVELSYRGFLLSQAVGLIKTHYKLTGIPYCSSLIHQQALQNAAWLLINDRRGVLEAAYRWFEEHGLKVKRGKTSRDVPVPVLPIKNDYGKVHCRSSSTEKKTINETILN